MVPAGHKRAVHRSLHAHLRFQSSRIVEGSRTRKRSGAEINTTAVLDTGTFGMKNRSPICTAPVLPAASYTGHTSFVEQLLKVTETHFALRFPSWPGSSCVTSSATRIVRTALDKKEKQRERDGNEGGGLLGKVDVSKVVLFWFPLELLGYWPFFGCPHNGLARHSKRTPLSEPVPPSSAEFPSGLARCTELQLCYALERVRVHSRLAKRKRLPPGCCIFCWGTAVYPVLDTTTIPIS